MDTGFIAEYIPLYVEATKLTIGIGLIGIALSLIVGLVISMIQYFKVPVLRQISAVYIELSRNTPLLVQLFFLYFGLPKAGISISSEGCAIIGLCFLGGSYMAEAFRSGMESVAAGGSGVGSRHETEAGNPVCGSAAGIIRFRSGALRKRDFPDQGNIRVQRGGIGRSDVCGKGSDRIVLQDG